MPHIVIREEDNTVAGLPEEEFNVVYIPGLKEAGGTIESGKPTLFNSAKDFLKAITGTETGAIGAENLSAIMAKELLNLGLPVLYEVFAMTTNPKDFCKQAFLDGSSYRSALTDKGLYRIKYLTTGGYPNVADVSSAMLQICAMRGDCIALIDHKKDITVPKGKTYAEVVRTELASLETESYAKFGAAFTPWCRFNLSYGTATTIDLPGSFGYLSAYAKSVQGNPNWYASAGSIRGQIPSISEPLTEYGDADCAVLQARSISPLGDFGEGDNCGMAINPICNIRPFGYIIWGNRTLLNNSATQGLTASSFLNVRNLCCDIKKTLYSAAREFTFEQNSDILWVNFGSRIRPLLDKALSGNGIRGYRLVKETTDKKGRLKARIRIVPIEAVEDFDLTLEMTDTLETVTENM